MLFLVVMACVVVAMRYGRGAFRTDSERRHARRGAMGLLAIASIFPNSVVNNHFAHAPEMFDVAEWSPLGAFMYVELAPSPP